MHRALERDCRRGEFSQPAACHEDGLVKGRVVRRDKRRALQFSCHPRPYLGKGRFVCHPLPGDAVEVRKYKITARRTDEKMRPVNNPVALHLDQRNGAGAVAPIVSGLEVNGDKTGVLILFCRCFGNGREVLITWRLVFVWPQWEFLYHLNSFDFRIKSVKV